MSKNLKKNRNHDKMQLSCASERVLKKYISLSNLDKIPSRVQDEENGLLPLAYSVYICVPNLRIAKLFLFFSCTNSFHKNAQALSHHSIRPADNFTVIQP